MISAVRAQVGSFLVVGGGIRSADQAYVAWKAGADMVVIGSVVEETPEILADFLTEKAHWPDRPLIS